MQPAGGVDTDVVTAAGAEGANESALGFIAMGGLLAAMTVGGVYVARRRLATND